MLPMEHPLILASASPRRRDLLSGLGVEFEVLPSSVDEAVFVETDAAKRAQGLATLKAKDIAQKYPERVVIGCDTLVVSSRGEILEKPTDAEDARRMLTEQSGSVSLVHSGLSVLHGERAVHGLSSSKVHFRALRPQDIDWWVSTGLWEDRSGGFQIDGHGQLLIEHLEGDFTSVVGLPVFLLGKLLEEVGYSVISSK